MRIKTYIFGLLLCAAGCQSPSHQHGFYTVQNGDTRFKIYQKVGMTEQQLSALNPGVDFTHLQVGQRIEIYEQKIQ